MPIQIAVIKLSKDNVSWYDKENNIYLTTPDKLETVVYDNMKLEPIRKGLKYKNIFLIEGEIPLENDYLSTDEEVDLKLQLHVKDHHTGGGSGFSGDYNDLTNKPTIPVVDVNKAYVDSVIQTIELTPGPKGDTGKTPQRGIDYFTEEDIISLGLGDLKNLKTNNKSDIVSAINELFDLINSMQP